MVRLPLQPTTTSLCIEGQKDQLATGPARDLRTVVSDGQVTREAVTCPPLLPDYQTLMRGVDRGDQLIGYHNIGRRLKKWWKECLGM